MWRRGSGHCSWSAWTALGSRLCSPETPSWLGLHLPPTRRWQRCTCRDQNPAQGAVSITWSCHSLAKSRLFWASCCSQDQVHSLPTGPADLLGSVCGQAPSFPSSHHTGLLPFPQRQLFLHHVPPAPPCYCWAVGRLRLPHWTITPQRQAMSVLCTVGPGTGLA